jgi:hypothetical protein
MRTGDANGVLLEIAVTLKVVRSNQDTSMGILQLETLAWNFQVKIGLVARCWTVNAKTQTLTSSVPIRQSPYPLTIEGVQLLDSASHHPIAMNPQHKGYGSQAQSAVAKRARWEDELATPPSETSPTATLLSGAHHTQIHGGTYTAIGGNVQNNYHNYGPQTPTTDILEILRNLPLPNFRDIQLDTLSKATDGTCTGVTSGNMYHFWIEKGKILWGIGIRTLCILFNAPRCSQIELAGAGKTVLS